LAKDLRNKKFAREFILASVEEDTSLQRVLGAVVRAYGIKEFAELIEMPSPNLVRALSDKANPTVSTLSRILEPFGLTISVTPVQKKRAA